MAVMAKNQPRISKAIFIAIVTLLGCHGSPMLCPLRNDATAVEIYQYHMCVKARLSEAGLPLVDSASKELELLNKQHLLTNRLHLKDHYLDFLDDEELHTFPACSNLQDVDCRSLLNILEDLIERLEVLMSDSQENDTIRRRRSAYYPMIHLLRSIKRGSERTDTQNLLMMYHSWREENGYGQARGRWGRSTKRHTTNKKVEKLQTISRRTVKKLANNLNTTPSKRKGISNGRSKRSFGGEGFGEDIYSILEQYKLWRDEHGYGKFTGRWGK